MFKVQLILMICCLSFLHNDFYGQISIAEYVNRNAVRIDQFTTLKEVDSLKLLAYNAYFFGEDHEAEQISYKEISFIHMLSNKIRHVFVEYPIGYFKPYIELMNLSPKDTTSEGFEFYSGKNKNQEILLRYFYKKNIGKPDSLKYYFMPIDVIRIEQIKIDNILWFFKRKNRPKEIRRDYLYFQNIKASNLSEDSLLSIYLSFREKFYEHRSIYQSYLQKDFWEMKNDLDGIYAYSFALKEDTICACRSKSREMFMLKNLTEQISTDSIKNFISINGAFHIPLSIQKNWEGIEEWESLAAKFKKSNPEMNVCSIYFMERNFDRFDNKYFPKEKQMILENTKPGETYLIRLDGENTPFKELSEKFQYIVVW